MRIYYNVSTMEVNTVEHKLFQVVTDQTTSPDFITYEPTKTYVSGVGNVYAQVVSTGGEVTELLPVTPVEADEVTLFNLLYHNLFWWYRLS